MRLVFPTTDIIETIKKSLSTEDNAVARNLFLKNRKAIEAEDPAFCKELDRRFSSHLRDKERKRVSRIVRKSQRKNKTNQPSQKYEAPQKTHREQIIEHLYAGRPLLAYRIFNEYRPITKANFIKLCKKVLSSELLKDTMNRSTAEDEIRNIIESIETGNLSNIKTSSKYQSANNDHLENQREANLKRLENEALDRKYGDFWTAPSHWRGL